MNDPAHCSEEELDELQNEPRPQPADDITQLESELLEEVAGGSDGTAVGHN